MDGKHQVRAMCTKGAERKLKRLWEEGVEASMKVAFQAYGRSLKTVTVFKDLGRALTTSDENWPEVIANIWKDWIRWTCLYIIWGWEEENPVPPELFTRR